MAGELTADPVLAEALCTEPMRLAPGDGAAGIPIALWLARTVRPRVLVFCGGRPDNTYFAYCQGLAADAGATRAFASLGGASDVAARDARAWNDAWFRDISALLPDEALADAVADGTVDLLHVAGRDARETARSVARWLPKLSARAVVVTETSAAPADLPPWPGFAFAAAQGTFVFAAGTAPPPAIRSLVAADAAEADAIRDPLARRGAVLEARLSRAEAALAAMPAERPDGPVAVATKVAIRQAVAVARRIVVRLLRAFPWLLPRHPAARALRQPSTVRPRHEDNSIAVPFRVALGRLEAPRAAAICHVFHVETIGDIVAHLLNVPFPIDVYVSTDTEAKRQALLPHFADWPAGAVEVRVMPNRGRDIAPKLVGFHDVHARYDYVLHLHSKRSAHAPALVPWRRYLYRTLLGSPGVVRSIFEIFETMPQVGMIAPQHFPPIRPYLGWFLNLEASEALARRMSLGLRLEATLDYPSGSMFWARTAALRPLLDLKLSFEDFPEERGQLDGTTAHAIEHLYFMACEAAGFDWVKVADPGLLDDQAAMVRVDSAEMLRERVGDVLVRLEATEPRGGG